MPLQLHELSLDTLNLPTDGKPLLLPIDAIDEDPDQPRVEFDAESLRELASTIAERGVRQPISVRAHPDVPGRWRLNFGARRLRASRAAGKLDIPAFVDEAADHYDQVIENEQRDKLTVLEMSLFIARCLRAGDAQAEIARRLGKSRQYVTLATALIDAPDWLMSAYREGRCRGLNELYELRRLHERHPAEVGDWVGARTSVTRGDLDLLRGSLAGPQVAPEVSAQREAPGSTSPRTRSAGLPAPAARPGLAATQHVLVAEVDGCKVEVLLYRNSSRPDQVFVRAGDGRTREVRTNALQCLALARTPSGGPSGKE